VETMQDEFKRGGEFEHLLLRYTQALITQISQTASAIAFIQWNSGCAAGC
jgi:hypothetical protein